MTVKDLSMKYIKTSLKGMALLFIVGVYLAFPTEEAFSQTRCLDYWSTGPAKCKPKQPEQKPEPKKAETPAPPRPQAQTLPPEEQKTELEKDIEQFYDRHGKPPEEFVRFYMDPSPENALAWVKKYNENILRSRQLASAWTQAQKVYDDFETQGLEVPPELLPEYARNPKKSLPPVQDLGINIPGEDVFSRKAPAPTGLGASLNPNALLEGQNPLQNGKGNVSVTVTSGSLTANLPPEALTYGAPKKSPLQNPLNAASSTAPTLKISYYFSAECPFCEKFEPGFKKVLSQLKTKAEVTCIDMTPSGQTKANINGKVDCAWRPLQPGEMQAFGVEATPTIIVDRGPDKPLERLSGYVSEEKLRSYLIK